jgi:hypothetical protein
MKLNISYPANGSQKLIEIEDERKLRDFMEKRVCHQIFSRSRQPAKRRSNAADSLETFPAEARGEERDIDSLDLKVAVWIASMEAIEC